jgi:hypothetical protein
MIEIIATSLMPLLAFVGIVALPTIFIQAYKSPHPMPWGMRAEFALFFLATICLLGLNFLPSSNMQKGSFEQIITMNREIAEFLLVNTIENLFTLVPTNIYQYAALAVIAWILLKPVYVLGKWILSGFKRPARGVHPLMSALMPAMMFLSPFMFVFVVVQPLLETFGMVAGTIFAIGAAIAQLAIILLFLGGFGDFMRRRR